MDLYSKAYLEQLVVTKIDTVITKEEIEKWLKLFFKRFFQAQFKRSCCPDGPKVGSVGLSPRGDWRMPSDADFDLWCNNE